MLKHVVMWKLSGTSLAEKREQGERIRAALQGLVGKIPGMTSLEVGLSGQTGDEQADVVLITVHESASALKVYQEHPDHQAVARLIGELRVERRVLDFEM